VHNCCSYRIGDMRRKCYVIIMIIICFFFYLDCETIGTAATPGLLCQPRVIMKMIVDSMME
jgi:hypothetical protein